MLQYISYFFEKENILDTVICYLEPNEIVNFSIGKYSLHYRIDEIKDAGMCFIGACYGGCIETVKLTIEKGANDWNYGLYMACFEGHTEIIKLMIEKGANNWNMGLLGARHSNNLDLVKLMIEKGATNIQYCIDNYSWGAKNRHILEYLETLPKN